MKLRLHITAPDWWLWLITLACLVAGLAAWPQGFMAAVVVSSVNLVYVAWREHSLTAFPSQVRLVYLALVAVALLDGTRILYGLLTLGTVMVVLFDRCVIARGLVLMPWNRDVSLE